MKNDKTLAIMRLSLLTPNEKKSLNLVKTTNLSDPKRTMEFDQDTAPIYAVAYAYCFDNSLTSELFKHTQNNTLDCFYETLPITVGQHSIACGDWATLL